MKNTRLYLDNWAYNASNILQEMENIVLSNGGAIVSTWKQPENGRDTYTVTNRILSSAIRKQEELVEKINKYGKDATNAEKELAELKAIDNSEKVNFYGNWLYIIFVVDSVYYHVSLNDNPFFDFNYSKIKVENGAISPDCYMNELKKDWLYDCFFTFRCNDEDRKEAATMIYNQVINGKFSTRYNGKRRAEKLNILAE